MNNASIPLQEWSSQADERAQSKIIAWPKAFLNTVTSDKLLKPNG
jgi:hypothetical protein